jgi:tetratricopeptide (TPR) repeat protein
VSRALLGAACAIGLWLARAPAVLASAAHGESHWMRLETRIENDYFARDARSLQSLAAALSAGTGPEQGLRSYYAGLLAYRLALLSSRDERREWRMAARCVTSLDRSLALDPDSAEALALQSACLAIESSLDPWRAPLAGPLSLMRSDKALRLAPDNPRVLLLGALSAEDRPRLFGGDRRRDFDLIKRAVAAFQAQPADPRGVPAWGAADAYTYLARGYLSRGDALAARDALERALLIAPDFAQARRLMAMIVSG